MKYISYSTRLNSKTFLQPSEVSEEQRTKIMGLVRGGHKVKCRRDSMQTEGLWTWLVGIRTWPGSLHVYLV